MDKPPERGDFKVRICQDQRGVKKQPAKLLSKASIVVNKDNETVTQMEGNSERQYRPIAG